MTRGATGRRPRATNRDGEISEHLFQTRVVNLARFYGWTRIFHAPNGGHAPVRPGARRIAGGQLPEGRGFPDLVLIRGHELLFVELKTDKGRLGPGQQKWLDAIARVGDGIDALAPSRVEAHLWRPADMDALHTRLAVGRVRQEPTW